MPLPYNMSQRTSWNFFNTKPSSTSSFSGNTYCLFSISLFGILTYHCSLQFSNLSTLRLACWHQTRGKYTVATSNKTPQISSVELMILSDALFRWLVVKTSSHSDVVLIKHVFDYKKCISSKSFGVKKKKKRTKESVVILTTLYRNGDIFVSFCWLSFKVLMVVLLEVALIHVVLGLSHWWEKLIKQHFFGGPNYRWCIIRFVAHGDRNLAAELSFCHLHHCQEVKCNSLSHIFELWWTASIGPFISFPAVAQLSIKVVWVAGGASICTCYLPRVVTSIGLPPWLI